MGGVGGRNPRYLTNKKNGGLFQPGSKAISDPRVRNFGSLHKKESKARRTGKINVITNRAEQAFERIKEQEDSIVKYWFENKAGDIISLVKMAGNDGEIRVTGKKITPFAIPTDMFDKLDADHILQVALRAIERRKST